MATMTVRDLIESLFELDLDMPIHKWSNIGMDPIDIDQAGYTFQKLQLMQSKNDPNFYAGADDPIFKKMKGEFEDPFWAVTVG